MLTAEIDTKYDLGALSFSSNLKSEIDSRFTSKTKDKKRTNRFTYTVGAFNLLLEQEIKVENLSNLTINVIPHAPKWCNGIVNVRGVIMPIVDMHVFLKTGIKNPTKDTTLIRLEQKDHPPIIFQIDKLPEMVFLDDYTKIEMPEESPNWLIQSLKNGTNTLYEINHSELMQQLKSI